MIGAKILETLLAKEGLRTDTIDRLFTYVIVGTVVGARLAHCLIYEPEIYLHDPIRILKVWEGGLASHGGTLGVIICVGLWRKKYWDAPMIMLLDFLAVAAPLTASLIRMGNFFNSEIIGPPTHLPWAVIFERVDMQPRHPSMLYESFAYLIVFGLMVLLYSKKLHRGRVGLLLGAFLIMLFGARFGIEFIKEPQVASETTMTLDFGQWLSLPFIGAGVFLVARALKGYAPALDIEVKSKKSRK
jgi:prolipoprotein diacylglyceryl transferase